MNYKIITAVTTEPVTLSEAKLHLRQTSDSFADDVTTYQSIAPGSHETAASYSLLGAAVDVLGYISLVTLNAGACGSGGSVAAKIQESDDGTAWQDYSGGAFATVTVETENTVQEIDYTGGKQYVRIAATVAGAACSFGADIIIKSGDAQEDTEIEDLITSAREHCESYTRRALATQTLEAYPDHFPCRNSIELPRAAPLQSITSVKYINSDGEETTMTADTEYITDTDSPVGRIVLPYGKNWPCFTPYSVNPIKIRYAAGYNSENQIPKSIRQAMLLHIGFFHANRDAVELGPETDRAIKSLLAIWKVGWF